MYSPSGGIWRTLGESVSRHHGNTEATPTSSAHSMFPIENYELVYNRWEDHVIWDSDAVTTIPPPSLPRIDPNDPNFILGLPDEPSPPPTAEKESKKVGKDERKFIIINKLMVNHLLIIYCVGG